MIKYPLMRSNFSRADLDRVIALLREDDPRLTNGPKVRDFEAAWSDWLGVGYSVFVNSGSSANLLSMAILRRLHPEGGEVIVPPFTWVSDISSVLQCGFKPVFADIDPRTLGMDTDAILKKISPSTKAVFLTHAQGFNALTDRLIQELKARGIVLVEDVCESHGAMHGPSKAGTFGLMSNFSFYYAHHMSTIEGGMVCTNDRDIYEDLRMLRSHGLVRELGNPEREEQFINCNPDLTRQFIFAFPAYNVRNTEIGAILGLSQLERLDTNNATRTANLERFLGGLDDSKYQTDFLTEGSSNYALNVVLKEADDALMERLEARLVSEGVEYRRGSAGGGNQLRQPYLRVLLGDNEYLNYPAADHIHFYGMYIGNSPALAETDIDELCRIVNSA